MDNSETPRDVPAATLLRLVRDVWDPIEVKVILTAALLGAEDVPVRESNIVGHEGLVTGVRADGSLRDQQERAAEALEVAIARGSLIRLAADDGTRWIVLGTNSNRRRTRSGLAIDFSDDASPPVELRPERPGVFAVYEQNIGLVTPIVADRLVDALERYPESWIIEAVGEAVTYNRRNWRYVQRILENWASEGRSDETHRGTSTRDLDREKHLRGKYAAVFRRDPE